MCLGDLSTFQLIEVGPKLGPGLGSSLLPPADTKFHPLLWAHKVKIISHLGTTPSTIKDNRLDHYSKWKRIKAIPKAFWVLKTTYRMEQETKVRHRRLGETAFCCYHLGTNGSMLWCTPDNHVWLHLLEIVSTPLRTNQDHLRLTSFEDTHSNGSPAKFSAAPSNTWEDSKSSGTGYKRNRTMRD